MKQIREIKKTLQFIGRESILCSSDAHLAKPDEKTNTKNTNNLT